MSFQQDYQLIKQTVSTEINFVENKMVENISLSEPLNSSLKKFLLGKSKRIREVLPILYVKSFGKSLNENQLEVLSIVEIVHNASLIHDDIIDESDLRRGQKTVSFEFGSKLAVIAGDYLLSLALEKLCKIANVDIIKQFAATIKNMCVGEVEQNYARFKKGTIEDYIEKTKNKTAYLFETAFLTCAMADGNSQYDLKSLSRLGLAIGIAFQIRDDLLNMTDVDNSKPANSDINSGIYNAPVILGSESDNYASGIEKTKGLLNNYIEQAKNELKLLPENSYSLALYRCLELLNNV